MDNKGMFSNLLAFLFRILDWFGDGSLRAVNFSRTSFGTCSFEAWNLAIPDP